ncbi:MAG: kynureninase [Proteobacteria bacterium]|nr:kynureninase [Pseudomonadota bacterium]
MSTPPIRALDTQDELRGFRSRFVIDDAVLYLDGNSLGRLPLATINAVRLAVEDEWARELVLGWEHWIELGETIGDRLAPLIGAEAGEVVLSDQTSINLFKVASAGLASTGRSNIITDRGNFPSDRYILEAVARSAGGELRFVPEDPTLDDLSAALDASVGVVSLSHVAYRSGVMLDGAAVTAVAHDAGALMVWDLAHSAGSVPVALNEWNADLAVGCTYKYLNGGPGSPGFLYVRSDLVEHLEQPISGWFSHADQFEMAETYEPARSIRRFVVGTPPIISLVCARVGIDMTAEAGIDAIRRKSIALTSMFAEGLTSLRHHGLVQITPSDPGLRGSHVTVSHPAGYQISQALRSENVIPDFREPDLVRFGFAPLYNTYAEVERALEVLESILDSGAHTTFPEARGRVT